MICRNDLLQEEIVEKAGSRIQWLMPAAVIFRLGQQNNSGYSSIFKFIGLMTHKNLMFETVGILH